MGRKTDITRAEVADAIIAILAAGARPSWEAVRERVDQRGSPVVLNRMIAEWFEENGPALTQLVPAGEEVAMRNNLRTLTDLAYAEFEAKQATRIAQLDERAAALDGREQNLADREAALDEREHGQREYIEHLHSQLRDAEAARTEVDGALQHARTDLAASLALIEHHKSELTQRDENTAALRGELQDQQQLAAKAQGALDSAVAELKATKAESQALHAQLDEARRQREVAIALNDAATNDLRDERTRSQAAGVAQDRRHAELVESLSSALTQVASKDAAVAELGQEVAALREQLLLAQSALQVAKERAEASVLAQGQAERVEAYLKASEQRIIDSFQLTADKLTRTREKPVK